MRLTKEAPSLDDDAALRWPAERFFWAIIEAPAGLCKRAGALPQSLVPDLASQVPAPVEDLHAVCAPLGEGRIVACAAVRIDLNGTDGALSLTPECFPAELDLAGLDPSILNLLVGPFEPLTLRRARGRRLLTRAGFVLVLLGLVTVGSLRRAAHAHAVTAAAAGAAKGLLALLGPSTTQPSLRAELDSLSRSAGFDLASRRSPDAAAGLEAVLSVWPSAIQSRPQSVSIGPDGVSIAVLVPGNPADFVSALRPLAGWRLDEPSLVSVGAQTRINLHLRATQEAKRP
jgi:hypothetical protein